MTGVSPVRLARATDLGAILLFVQRAYADIGGSWKREFAARETNDHETLGAADLDQDGRIARLQRANLDTETNDEIHDHTRPGRAKLVDIHELERRCLASVDHVEATE